MPMSPLNAKSFVFNGAKEVRIGPARRARSNRCIVARLAVNALLTDKRRDRG